jgi:HNH endonuclease
MIVVRKRQCTKCKREYPETKEFFYVRKSGLDSWCKECKKVNAKEYKLKNKEKYLEYQRQWHQKNKKKHNEQNKEWHRSNKKRAREIYNEWVKNNRERMNEHGRFKRMHKSHNISEDEWKSCLQYFDYKCAYCGMKEEDSLEKYKNKLHKEHVDHDGDNDLSNCVPACKGCNSSKHTSSLDNWYNESNSRFTTARMTQIQKWLKTDYSQFTI